MYEGSRERHRGGIMGEEAKLYDYNWLLERAYEMLPKRPAQRRERFVVPKPEIMVSGRRTFIVNFKQICDVLNRDPRLVLRYLLKELGAPGELGDTYAVLQGEMKPRIIVALMDRFVRDYVICPVCGSPDTVLTKEKKAMFIKCMACGAVSATRPF